MRAVLAAAPFAAAAAAFAAPAAIDAFSSAAPGARLPPGWHVVTIARRKPPDFSLVRDEEATVLRVQADAAAGSIAHALSIDPGQRPMLAWRWKVDRALDKARLGVKDGDDFAARVYVSFDLPRDVLPLAARAKWLLARLLYGPDVPVVAICYVWDNRAAPGTRAWSPYSEQVRMVVLESGNGRAGEWVAERRDVDADFREAFGALWKNATPRVAGVAVAADTDQTLERVTAWFGDLSLEPRP